MRGGRGGGLNDPLTTKTKRRIQTPIFVARRAAVGASNSTISLRRQRSDESDAPSTAQTRGPLPRFSRGRMSASVLAMHPRPSFASRNVKQRRIVARIERSESRVRLASSNGDPGVRCAHPGLRRKKEAERRQTQCFMSPCQRARRRATDKAACAALTAIGRARLPAFHHGACGSDRTPPLSSSSRASRDGTR